ncbi:LysR family transcriptional regulator [Virgisporangium aliadipatigenens]|uniref:LysR family transcriptional regulator n=1 Tax=Virgisporangium aliadipatigenens TaxID=741659 RepID=A0A8J3YSW5_9ACTN|nr:LysR family transcriptional regulator [Virgisporangium aliadipatigenens]GIJ49335.1 LysR family transcriptional regulator [Virgisporangium aliadipatigenens]
MQIDDLRRLIALAGHERVTDAAAALRLSQPTVSRLLARAEHTLGTRLFERDARGVHPNPHGELMLAAAREIVERYDRLRRDLGDLLDPDSGTVRLGFLNSMSTSVVPPLLRDFRRAAPRVRVTLRQAPSHELLQDLATGTAELAIMGPRPTGPHGWIALQRQRLVLAVAPGHRLAGRKRVRLPEYADEELVTVPTGFGFRALVDELYAAEGLLPRVSFESEDLATVEGLAGAGLGVALLPEPQAGVSTVVVPLGAAAQRVVGLTWRTDRVAAAPAARFLEFVRDAVR